MNLKQQQKGLSLIAWLVVIAVLAFFTVSGLRLFPLYMESFTVSSVLDAVASESGVSKLNKRAVWSRIEKRLDVNSINNVGVDNFSIDVTKGVTTYTIAYEVRTVFMGNLDVVAVFEKSAKANPN